MEYFEISEVVPQCDNISSILIIRNMRQIIVLNAGQADDSRPISVVSSGPTQRLIICMEGREKPSILNSITCFVSLDFNVNWNFE